MKFPSPLSEQSRSRPPPSRGGQSSKGEAQIRCPQSQRTRLGARAQASELQSKGPVFTSQPYSEPSPPGRGPPFLLGPGVPLNLWTIGKGSPQGPCGNCGSLTLPSRADGFTRDFFILFWAACPELRALTGTLTCVRNGSMWQRGAISSLYFPPMDGDP